MRKISLVQTKNRYHWEAGDSVKAATDISPKVPTDMTGEVLLYFPYEDHHGNRFVPNDETRNNLYKRNPNRPPSGSSPKDDDYMFQFKLLPDKENMDYYFVSWDSNPGEPGWVQASEISSLGEGEKRMTPEEVAGLIESRKTTEQKEREKSKKDKKDQEKEKRILPTKTPRVELVDAQPGDIVGVAGAGGFHLKYRYMKTLPNNKCTVMPLGSEDEEDAFIIDRAMIKKIYDPNIETHPPARSFYPPISPPGKGEKGPKLERGEYESEGEEDEKEASMEKIDKQAVDNFAKTYWNKVLTEMSSKDKIAKLVRGAKVEVIPTGAIGEIVKVAGGKPPKFDVRLGDGKVYRIVFSCLGVPKTKGKSKKKILSLLEKEKRNYQGKRIISWLLDQEAKKTATTPEAQEAVGDKIKKLREEGKPEDQAIAIALETAREKGYKVPEKKSSEEKVAVDNYFKSVVTKYLKSTGYGEHLLRVAMNRMEKLLKEEDFMTPAQMDASYNKISVDFKDKGGEELLRIARIEALRQMLREANLGSTVFKATKEAEESLKKGGFITHYYGDLGFTHLKNKDEYNRIKACLVNNAPDYYVPGEWL